MTRICNNDHFYVPINWFYFIMSDCDNWNTWHFQIEEGVAFSLLMCHDFFSPNKKKFRYVLPKKKSRYLFLLHRFSNPDKLKTRVEYKKFFQSDWSKPPNFNFVVRLVFPPGKQKLWFRVIYPQSWIFLSFPFFFSRGIKDLSNIKRVSFFANYRF